MTWRAFIIGLASVVGIGLLDPYTSFNQNYGWNTQSHLPPAAVLVLAVLALGLNAVLKKIKARFALKRAELMLIWCMLIVGCAFPSNLMRFWFPVMAAPAYLGRRPDIQWKESAFREAPEGLLLSKDTRSVAAERFYEGSPGEEARVPWRRWLPPVLRWGLLLVFFYGATFFMCALLRRQWVDRERLQFPLARIPLEFTEGSGRPGVLVSLMSSRAFQLGLVAAGALRAVRMLPLLFEAETGWNLMVPLGDVFGGTPLQGLQLVNFQFNWVATGLAYLVPADVSLSIWFFYLFGRGELQASAWLGSTLHQGGSGSELIQWQRLGAYIAFTVGALYMARRHVMDVVRKALGRGADVDDSDEPVGFALGFWAFLLCLGGAVGWFVYYGMRWWSACLFLLLLFCIQFVHSRVVAQSGLYRTAPPARAPGLLNALGLGHVFVGSGAMLSSMQYTVMINGNNSMLGPAAIHAFRIGEVFERRRRLLIPILMVAVVAAVAASSWTCLQQAYSGGALNFSNRWAAVNNPSGAYQLGHMVIERPDRAIPLRSFPLALGGIMSGLVMILRSRFYWWPIHPIGLLALASYGLDRMWFSFMVGWLLKVLVMKFATGRLLRRGREFVIGFIIVECVAYGAWTLLSFATRGAVPGAGGWI